MMRGTTKTRTQIEKYRRMIDMEKKGLVKFISPKTFGVVLEGEDKVWYNPAKGLPVDLRLKGQKVVMDMVDNHTFRSIELDKEKPTVPTQLGKTDSLIVRQVAAKCASEMANTASEFKEIAEMVEKWILR